VRYELGLSEALFFVLKRLMCILYIMHSTSQSSSVLISFSETKVPFKLSPTFVNPLEGFCLLKRSVEKLLANW
jgi:hypothetical protein